MIAAFAHTGHLARPTHPTRGIDPRRREPIPSMSPTHLLRGLAVAIGWACLPAHATVAPPACAASAADPATLRAQRDWYAALAAIEQRLACAPGDRRLLRQRVLTLADIGSNDAAWRIARDTPGLLDAAEFEQLTSKRLARLIAWSEVGRDEPARLAAVHEALQASDAYLAQVNGKDSAAVVRTRLDRLLLLNRLGQHQQVADEQALLLREGTALPPYVIGAVSDSLMALRRPDEAAALLAPQLDGSVEGATMQVRHAFAELEMEHGSTAIEDLRAYADGQPPRRWDRQHRVRERNWARYDADLARIQITAYAGDAAAAQHELEAMLAIAPGNGALHSALGQAYLMRGWPRRALDRFHIAGMMDADDLRASIGEVEALMVLRREGEAAPLHARLVQAYPGSSRVAQLDRAWQRHRGWQWQVTAGGGDSAGGHSADGPLGSRDAEYAFNLLSPLIANAWRARAGYLGRQADLHGERVVRDDAYLGLQYARGAFDAAIDARWPHAATTDGTGWDIRLGWQLGDRWSLAGEYQRNADDASLQALQAGITADRHDVALRYQPDDLHALRLAGSRLDYDDGNRRDSLQARYEQQFLHADRWWLDGNADAYASRASLAGVPYFNPSRDASLALGLRISQRPWRDYDRHFLHRLEVGVGRYWQEGYGAAWIPSARYEHEWRLAPGRSLRYGLSWARPVYDGARERRLGLDAGFYWEE